MFTGFFDIKDANAAVNYGGKNGASEVGDLDFAGEEDRVVGWEGIWTFYRSDEVSLLLGFFSFHRRSSEVSQFISI